MEFESVSFWPDISSILLHAVPTLSLSDHVKCVLFHQPFFRKQGETWHRMSSLYLNSNSALGDTNLFLNEDSI